VAVDEVFQVRGDGTTERQILRCEAYTISGENRCTNAARYEVEELHLCWQHRAVAKRDSKRLDYWLWRKNPRQWRAKFRKERGL
jgi:hypothetical protein